MHRVFMLLGILVLTGAGSLARAACTEAPAEPIYRCDGGICSRGSSENTCPDGTLAQMRACSEAYLNSFGPVTFLDVQIFSGGAGGHIRWKPASNGIYGSPVTRVSQGQDCQPIERNLGQKSCPAKGGPMFENPVNTSLGNKYQNEEDYEASGSFPLVFHRQYNSAGSGDNSIGARWSQTFGRKLIWQSDAEIKLFRDDGEVLFFQQCGSLWCASADESGSLIQLTSDIGTTTGWEYTDENDVIEVYDGVGSLLSETSRTGVSHTLSYNTDAQLSSVTDSFGRRLSFSYDSSNRISQLTLPDNEAIDYAYDATGNLSSVTYPDNSALTYLYNESAYIAAGAGSNLLTGILDESTQRFATFQYNSQSRAVSTEHAGGANRLQLTYNSNGSVSATDGLGLTRTQTFQTVENVNHLSSVSGGACANCGLAANYSYSVLGDLTLKTDFNGNQISFSSNSTHLEESRTEAYGTAKARTITTQWNAIWRQPSLITEPNRTTAYTYDSFGNVLTSTISDTSVSPNVSRTWTYAYSGYGRVLTEDGPRTDVSDVTTYTYYSCMTGYQCGQLHTVTNAAGQTTTYETYNAHGQPLTISDANGVGTTLTYDARQRLTSRTTSGETTSFEYWPTGLLKEVTHTDGSYMLYTYDAAHRLYKLEDGQGNRIQYTLDAMGNRTAENVYDPSNLLARTRTQVFNTLNQLWKQIGAAGTAAVTTTLGYDNNGNPTTTNAPLARNSTNAYDELNRLKQITDPGNGVTRFGYDANDNLTSVTDPRNLVTSYTYDGFGNLKTQTSPDTGNTANAYDSGGNLKTSTDARNAITTYTYDALNRVSSVAFKVGTTTDHNQLHI